jgi:hypothetical protein
MSTMSTATPPARAARGRVEGNDTVWGMLDGRINTRAHFDGESARSEAPTGRPERSQTGQAKPPLGLLAGAIGGQRERLGG